MAISLRDFHRAGARSAKDYADSLEGDCRRLESSQCKISAFALPLGLVLRTSPDKDLFLFDEHSLPGPRLRIALDMLARQMTGLEPPAELLDVAVGAVADDDLDQSKASFESWLLRGSGRRAAVASLQATLDQAGVGTVAPLWQLLRTGSDWRGCGAPFEIPPRDLQAHITSTLQLVRDHIAPTLGPVEVKSSYRGSWLNACAGGAERSAHREFSAVDLVPLTLMDRETLMTKLCPIYASRGERDRLGLGFYAGVRFHIDTQRHRSWATENGQAYAPCSASGAVNPPLPRIPPSDLQKPPAPPSR